MSSTDAMDVAARVDAACHNAMKRIVARDDLTPQQIVDMCAAVPLLASALLQRGETPSAVIALLPTLFQDMPASVTDTSAFVPAPPHDLAFEARAFSHMHFTHDAIEVYQAGTGVGMRIPRDAYTRTRVTRDGTWCFTRTAGAAGGTGVDGVTGAAGGADAEVAANTATAETV